MTIGRAGAGVFSATRPVLLRHGNLIPAVHRPTTNAVAPDHPLGTLRVVGTGLFRPLDGLVWTCYPVAWRSVCPMIQSPNAPKPRDPFIVCPSCKGEMHLFGIEAEKPGRDLYTFGCPACGTLDVRGLTTRNLARPPRDSRVNR